MPGGREFTWSSGLYGLVEDIQATVTGAFCPCIVFGKNVHRISNGQTSFPKACLTHAALGGCWGTALCMIIGPIGFWCTCIPWHAAPYRAQLRKNHNLPEDPYTDFHTHFFCHPCALCQESRELDSSQAVTLTGPTEPTVDRGPKETIAHVNEMKKMQDENKMEA